MIIYFQKAEDIQFFENLLLLKFIRVKSKTNFFLLNFFALVDSKKIAKVTGPFSIAINSDC